MRWFKIKDFLPYLPVAIAIIAAFLGFSLGQKSSKITRFHQQVDTNLKEICGPMYFSLKSIFELEDEEKREKLLDAFFNKFSVLNSDIHKIGNKFIINWFVDNEELFFKFKQSRTMEDWENFWRQLDALKNMIEKDYWSNFNSLYGEYRLFQRTLTSNIFIRIWHELIHILYQASQFSIIASGFLLYLSIWDYFFINKFPSGSIVSALILFLSTIIIYGFLMIISSRINGLRNQKEYSWLRNFGNRYAPRMIKFWDGTNIKIDKNKPIPKMFNQRKQN